MRSESSESGLGEIEVLHCHIERSRLVLIPRLSTNRSPAKHKKRPANRAFFRNIRPADQPPNFSFSPSVSSLESEARRFAGIMAGAEPEEGFFYEVRDTDADELVFSTR